MYLTGGGSVQRPQTSGPRGWPIGQTPWSVGPTLRALAGQLHGDTLQEAVTGNPKLKVGGGRNQWPANHVARPAGQHLACYRLNQVSNSSLDPRINPPY
jgi:hypothetical protein